MNNSKSQEQQNLQPYLAQVTPSIARAILIDDNNSNLAQGQRQQHEEEEPMLGIYPGQQPLNSAKELNQETLFSDDDEQVNCLSHEADENCVIATSQPPLVVIEMDEDAKEYEITDESEDDDQGPSLDEDSIEDHQRELFPNLKNPGEAAEFESLVSYRSIKHIEEQFNRPQIEAQSTRRVGVLSEDMKEYNAEFDSMMMSGDYINQKTGESVSTDLQNQQKYQIAQNQGANEFMNIINMIKQNQYESHHAPPVVGLGCNCLEKLRLQVAQELDHLRGQFRKKENEILSPIINRYAAIEQRIDMISQAMDRFESRVISQENNMLGQERTVGIIIDILGKVLSKFQHPQQNSNEQQDDLIKLKQTFSDRQGVVSEQTMNPSFGPDVPNLFIESKVHPIQMMGHSSPIPKLWKRQDNIEEVKKLDSEDEGTEMMIHVDYTNATNSAPSSINTTALMESNSKYKRKRSRHSRRLTNAIIPSQIEQKSNSPENIKKSPEFPQDTPETNQQLPGAPPPSEEVKVVNIDLYPGEQNISDTDNKKQQQITSTKRKRNQIQSSLLSSNMKQSLVNDAEFMPKLIKEVASRNDRHHSDGGEHLFYKTLAFRTFNYGNMIPEVNFNAENQVQYYASERKQPETVFTHQYEDQLDTRLRMSLQNNQITEFQVLESEPPYQQINDVQVPLLEINIVDVLQTSPMKHLRNNDDPYQNNMTQQDSQAWRNEYMSESMEEYYKNSDRY